MNDQPSSKRAGVFDDDLDISGFAPKPPARAEQVKAVAEEAGFRSRGPLPVPPRAGPPPAAPAPRREQRRHRTGRNQQLNLKVRAEDAAAFYAIADAEGWVLGDVFARAVAALTKELQRDRK
ncbi:hypothetical protein ACFQS7_28470 [Dankookia sp. GCM10030260]|uniref:hypothetical protein n=1 Tax=Dankookia sp. GCM10030260 TaxID=3273390 RepID=UPI00361CC141